MKRIEHFLEKLMFASRWIMAPVYLGLIVCLVFLLYVFIHEIIVFIPLARAEEVIKIGERIIAKEKLMTEAVRSGSPVGAVMGSNYENMLDDLGK